ncbi:hypothetical protein NQ314_011729 [Rhamnusium bicolor]|uniref:Uncharacterized protein n=1 Tax=Rhamnusium bicolor TaxID=1586634 RepID=A0AAV8XG54_9CUCU|nr:hypothetical protein NQ314_011729 [Rhamnusium bicolor]
MSAYDFNPDVCLEVFHGIAEDIPSGVSGSDVKAIVPKIKFTQELLSYVRNTITTITRKAIDGLWINYQIAEKLKHLEELEEKSPKNDAW